MTHDAPGGRTPGPLAAVLVCGGAGCEHGVLDALRPLVRRTPHAVLIRTACLHPHDTCPDDQGSCALGVLLCDAHLRPVSACQEMTGTARAAYREVESWLDQTVPPLPKGGVTRT